MTSPQVTVLIPVFNGAKYLHETLMSLLRQSLRNFELIVVDDGSTDSSIDIVYSLNDTRIKVIRLDHQGLSQALNRGLQEASTPYVARNDQDDLSLPHRLERQLNLMTEYPEAECFFTYYTKFGKTRSWTNEDKQGPHRGPVKRFDPIKDGCQLGSTLFARTDHLRGLGGFRQEYYPADDWDLELRLAQCGKVFLFCEPLVFYRFSVEANTYRFFEIMQKKSRWAENSFYRREKKLPELSYEQFLSEQSGKWWSRLNRSRNDFAKMQMRIAGQRYLDGFDLAAFYYLIIAALLNPNDLIGRVKRLLARFLHQ
jgi:glycosyltransferase involved in cell wall biosynthesis